MLSDQRLCRVQIFRSIASDCVAGLYDAAKDNAQAYECGLVTGAAPALSRLILNSMPSQFDVGLLACLEIAPMCAARSLTVDKSVQHAYIHAIRRAQHFIYLENQCVTRRMLRDEQ